MKALLFNTSDVRGGAHLATYRLHRGLLGAGVDSKLIVQQKLSDDRSVYGPDTRNRILFSYLRPYLDSMPRLMYSSRTKNLFSSAMLPNSRINKLLNDEYDIAHLFWVTGGFLSVELLKKVRAPIVWTLHDMWPFTGGCHYDNECGKYKQSCGACPTLGSTLGYDLSRRILSRKNKAWKNIDITVVATSQWLASCAKESVLFKDRRIEVIPNGIDVARYKKIDKIESRRLYNLPEDKNLILFASLSPTKDKRKGFDYLRDALNKLDKTFLDNTDLVIVGTAKPVEPLGLDIKTHFIPRLNDELSQVVLYSAADLTVLPSLQENLANTIIESQLCGTPVVAFNIGGMPDMITHKHNGYLADPFSADDLQNGIRWVVNNLESADLSNNAREYAVKNYQLETVAKSYYELYQDILK